MRPAPSTPAPRLAPLAVVAGAVAAAAAVGALPRWPGLVHLVALPPLDLVGDLRVLLVAAPGMPTFAVGVVAAVAVRSVVLAGLLGGPDRATLGLALRFELLVLVPAAVAAALLHAAGAVRYQLLFWLGALAVLALVLLAGALPWTGARTLRRGVVVAARGGFRAGRLWCYLGALALLGALADVGGGTVAVGTVPLSAGLTVAAVRALGGDPGWRAVRRSAAVVPAVGVAALALVALTPPAPPAPPTDLRPERARPGTLALMAGIDSSSGRGSVFELHPAVLGWPCERTRHLSYAGPGDGQPRRASACPLPNGAPYLAADTLRGRDELVAAVEAQVRRADPPVVAVGHSQAAWVLWEAAAAERLPGVEAIVLVGPFPGAGVGYPAAGARAPGAAGRAVLDGLTAVLHDVGFTSFRPDVPLGREWLADPQAVPATFARPLPNGVRALSVTSSFDLPILPGGPAIDGAVDACPVGALHPDLPHAPALHEAVRRFLDGRPQPPCPLHRRLPGPLLRHLAAPPALR